MFARVLCLVRRIASQNLSHFRNSVVPVVGATEVIGLSRTAWTVPVTRVLLRMQIFFVWVCVWHGLFFGAQGRWAKRRRGWSGGVHVERPAIAAGLRHEDGLRPISP